MPGHSFYMCICMSVPQLLRDSNSNKGNPPQQLQMARLDGLTQTPRAACPWAALPSHAISVVEQNTSAAWSRRQRGAIPPWRAPLQHPPLLARARVSAFRPPLPPLPPPTDARVHATDRIATSGNHPRLRRLRLRLGRLRRLRRRNSPDPPPTRRRLASAAVSPAPATSNRRARQRDRTATSGNHLYPPTSPPRPSPSPPPPKSARRGANAPPTLPTLYAPEPPSLYMYKM